MQQRGKEPLPWGSTKETSRIGPTAFSGLLSVCERNFGRGRTASGFHSSAMSFASSFGGGAETDPWRSTYPSSSSGLVGKSAVHSWTVCMRATDPLPTLKISLTTQPSVQDSPTNWPIFGDWKGSRRASNRRRGDHLEGGRNLLGVSTFSARMLDISL